MRNCEDRLAARGLPEFLQGLVAPFWLHNNSAEANSALHQESGEAGLQSLPSRKMRSGIKP